MTPKKLRLAMALGAALLPLAMTLIWERSAAGRLETLAHATGADAAPTAGAADEGYCSADLKKILRRVLLSCGLIGRQGARGCQPLEAKNVATMSGGDFNALFNPMKERGGIVQFGVGDGSLDPEARALTEEIFSDQRGASYFLVVARASVDGPVELNRELSRTRAEAVLEHLREAFKDPDLDSEVGLLWLGEEYAQLDQEFCQWRRSRGDESCESSDVNRGAFLTWIDCTL